MKIFDHVNLNDELKLICKSDVISNETPKFKFHMGGIKTANFMVFFMLNFVIKRKWNSHRQSEILKRLEPTLK